MCGVLGIFGHDYIAQELYDGLITLQHRGQDAAGMITYDGRFHVRKELGLVMDVFHTRHMKRLKGYVGIGHTRYSTIGTITPIDAQPFLGPAPFGVILAHNGNVFNSKDLTKELFEKDHRMVNSTCDAEVLLNIFTKALTKQNADKIGPNHIWKAVESVYKRAQGAYSVVSYIAKQGMVAFRDPHGIRPLIFGRREKDLMTDYIFASESVALDILDFEYIDDVGAGEAIFIDEKTRKVYRKKINPKKPAPCIFEYVYFARPDSLIEKTLVYESRIKMGMRLAKKIKAMNLDIDVVMPIPDSARTAAFTIADNLGLKYRMGLVKNRYIGRTFIMPGQKIRKKSIRYKLNPIKQEIKGKKILLVDDSIVRGNTSRQIIQLVREAGAKKVYFAVYYPPVISPCFYGIDIPTKEELIGANYTVDEICKSLNADKVIYADVKDVFSACTECNPKLKNLCMACITGNYPTGDIDEKTFKKQAEARTADRLSCEMEEMEEWEEPEDQMPLI